MSDTGLHAGLYQYVRILAELVDKTLIEVKSKRGSPVSPERRQLGDMLLALSRKEWPDLTSRLLSLVLIDISGFSAENWGEVGQTLLMESIDESTVATLERLAEALEKEQLEAALRIRGSA